MKFRITTGLFIVSSVLLTLFIFGSNAYAQEADLTSILEETPAVASTLTPTRTFKATDSSFASTMDTADEEVIEPADLINLGLSVAIFFGFYLFGGRAVVAIFKMLARRSHSEFLDTIINQTAPGIGQLLTIFGLQFATLRLAFIQGTLRALIENIVFFAYWFVVTKLLWDLINFAVDYWFEQEDQQNRGDLFEQLRPIIRRTSQIGLLLVSIILLLAHFGVNMLAIMGALGLTGFAIALALKDSITNIISGFIIMFTQPFVEGDRLEISAIENWADVVSIGYRSTTCLTRDNTEVIVPNGIIVEKTIINYSRPDTSYRLQQDMDIGGDMDIGKVVKILMETVRDVEGVMEDKNVDVLFTGYGTALTFRVRWWIENYGDKRAITHRVMTAIQEAAEKENINMPDPAFIHDTKLSISDDELDKISTKLEGKGGSE